MLKILIIFVFMLSGILQVLYSQSIPKILYVVNTLGENLSSINLDNQTVNQNALTLGLYTNEVKIKGNKGYVINSGLNEIQVFDLAAMTTTDIIPLGSGTNPYNMDFINDSLAGVSLLFTNQLAIVNINSGQVENYITVGSGPEGVKFYAGKIYVTNTNFNGIGYEPGTVSIIDAVSQSVINTINVGKNPQSADIDANGNLIIGCTGNYSTEFGQVDVFDIPQDTLKYSIPFNTSITSVQINSLNKLYIGTFGFGVMVYNLNTKTFERDENHLLPGGPSVCFDNQSIAYIIDFSSDSVRAFSTNHQKIVSYLVGDGPVSIDIYNPAINSMSDYSNYFPDRLKLYQNYPNPFNPETQIKYYLLKSGNIQFSVFNLVGKQVYFISQNNVKAGIHNFTFTGSNLASGTYYYQLKAGKDLQTRRMILIK